MLRIKEIYFLLVAGAALALGACTTSPVPFFSDENAVVFDDSALSRGEISLECESIMCAFRWFTRQSAVAQLYDNGDWDALTEEVTALQYGQDLAYFYLGRAAEEAQAYDAAQLYFTRAQDATLSCAAGLFNRCRGIEVDVAARERSEQIAVMLAASEMDLADAQKILSDMGLYTTKVDGIYGPRTRAALQQFQERRRLSKTGKLDDATIRALASAEAAVRTRIAAVPRPKPDSAPEPAQVAVAAVPTKESTPDSKKPAAAPERAPSLAAKAAEPPVPAARASTRPAVVAAPSAAPEPAEPSIDSAGPQAAESGPMVVADMAQDAPPPSIVAISTTPAPLELAPADVSAPAAAEAAPLEISAVGPVAATPPAPVTEPATPSTGPEAPPEVDARPLAVASAVNSRSFEQDREAGRSRLKLEVDLLSQADPFAEVLGVVEQGAWVDVIDWGSEWSKVSHGDTTGFVYTEVLQ